MLLLPGVVLLSGLLMISQIRYPHLVNRYLRGKRPISRLIGVLVLLLLLVVAHQYVVAVGMMVYVLAGVFAAVTRARRHVQLP